MVRVFSLARSSSSTHLSVPPNSTSAGITLNAWPPAIRQIVRIARVLGIRQPADHLVELCGNLRRDPDRVDRLMGPCGMARRVRAHLNEKSVGEAVAGPAMRPY